MWYTYDILESRNVTFGTPLSKPSYTYEILKPPLSPAPQETYELAWFLPMFLQIREEIYDIGEVFLKYACVFHYKRTSARIEKLVTQKWWNLLGFFTINGQVPELRNLSPKSDEIC